MKVPAHFSTDPGFDHAEDHIGPFYYARVDDELTFAFVAEQKHCNVTQVVHGGVLMTFADYAACMVATNHYDGEDCVTISFSGEFIRGGDIGSLIEARCTLTRQTRSMTFVRGEVFSGETTLYTFSSVMKRLPHERQ